MKFYEFGWGKDVADYNYHQKRIADTYGVDLALAGCYLVNYENDYICHKFNGGCESCDVCRRIHEEETNGKDDSSRQEH